MAKKPEIVVKVIKKLQLTKTGKYLIFIPQDSGLTLEDLGKFDSVMKELGINNTTICLVKSTKGIKVLKQSPLAKPPVITQPKKGFFQILSNK